ncbi:MAG: caspase family protein [Phycisphaerales bacterium]|nr:caspase family protein [Phycisphaerales bacterium]
MAKTALCIGINDYPGTGSDLSGCVNDVKDWKEVLEKKGFNVTTLLDRDATKNNMVEALTKLLSDANAKDTVVFQYSGHGSYVYDASGDETDGRDEVLCPSDIGSNAYFSDDELYEMFCSVKAGVKVVFLSDSCHSGSVSKFRVAVDVGDKTVKSRFLPPGMFLRDFEMVETARSAEGRGSRKRRAHRALLISGCQDHQTSADAWFNNRANGAFSYFALKALKELPAGSTYKQWHAKIRDYLPNVYYNQAPNLYSTKGQSNWKIFE